MSQISKKVLLVIILLLGFTGFAQKKLDLTINIENTYLKKGFFYIAIFNSEKSFMKTALKKMKVSHSVNRVVFPQLSPGRYSVTIYQDLDNNKKLNKMLSMPTEPYGISNNPSGYPSFDNSSFEMKNSKSISIQLKN
jgi:uncharacterized protein (DUF2141 family)